ncbi:porin [Sedimenticola hydrogenitrophicus]|uniref:porin n=1 Tax=Sedimenticola hydrogenitrophicus TaxID=2967975 RepID=UPI0021A82C50|nr:porin [Sedimenticola hydrogenitrophicus]
MKKLLSIAIAAAVAAPMAVSADTTIYGLIDNALTNNDNGTTDSWDIEEGNGTSRFGVKGSEDLGNGLKALFQYEWDTESTEGGSTSSVGLKTRLAYVGIAGNFGTVAIGRQWTPYYGAVGKTNIMNAPSTGFRQHLNTFRTGNALAYVSPNFNGFSAAIAFVIDDTASNDIEDGADATNLALNYNNGPLSVGLGYHTQEATGAVAAVAAVPGNAGSAAIAAAADVDIWGLSGKYNFGNFAVIASYEEKDTGSSSNTEAWGLGAEAYFGNNTVRALVGNTDTGAADTDAWAIGVQHNFSKRTRVYAEYAEQDAGATDQSEFALGVRHDF